jgi:hypothetical protein
VDGLNSAEHAASLNNSRFIRTLIMAKIDHAKGVKVVVLEAGAMQFQAIYINDEWKSFSQLAWRDNRTNSGSWRWPRTFPICLPGSARRLAAPPPAGQAHQRAGHVFCLC